MSAGGKKLWLGLAVSVFFMYLLVRNLDFRGLAEAFRSLDPLYLLPALLGTLFTYYVRAWRWWLLLRPLKRTSMTNVLNATLVGYMANNLLPARIGELVRAFVLGEKEGLPKGAALGTLVLDRFLDGLCLLAMLLVALLTLRLPQGMEPVREKLVAAGYATVAVAAVAAVILSVLAARRDLFSRLCAQVSRILPARFRERFLGFSESFAGGLLPEGKVPFPAGLFVSSLLMWVVSIWCVQLIIVSFGIAVPFTAAVFIMVLIVFAVMVPASPGYIGTYHAACVYGLMAFDLSKEKALSIALVLHGMGFLPVTLLGLLVLARENMSLRQITHRSEER